MNIVVAIDINNGIGKNGKIPWNYPKDLLHFRKLTIHNTVLMGRKTWDSLTSKPLSWRLNIVLTRNKKLKFPKQVIVIHDFESIPWVGLIVAISWSFYNLLRKIINVDTDIGLLIESLFILPVILIAFL